MRKHTFLRGSGGVRDEVESQQDLLRHVRNRRHARDHELERAALHHGRCRPIDGRFRCQDRRDLEGDRLSDVANGEIAGQRGGRLEPCRRRVTDLDGLVGQAGLDGLGIGRGRVELVNEEFLRNLALPDGASQAPEPGRDSAQ